MRRVQWLGLVAVAGILMMQACSDDKDPTVAKVKLALDPGQINDGESTTVTITASNADGSNGEGSVTLTAAAGTLSPATVNLSDGKATATYTCNASQIGCAGNIRIFGRWNELSSSAVVIVGDTGSAVADSGTSTDAGDVSADGGVVVTEVGPPVSMSWVSTVCGGSDCRLMGIRSSGFNEQAQISFRVEDVNNLAVRSVAVTFSLIGAPTGTALESTTATTNSNGMVVARVTSGLVIGAFTVRADVTTPTALTAISPTIGVRGAKPSNRGFTFQCAKVNLDVYTTAQPPRQQPLSCTVGLVDRYNNPVGTGTSVFFKTEAGAIANSIATTAFDPADNATNSGEGTAAPIFRTGPGGSFPPLDVPPLAADSSATQWPFTRGAEPTNVVQSLTLNPRDNLATMLAYVQGEEHFWDDNANGTRDSSERFIDQGEPFVDSNDDNTWNAGETFIDSNNNGSWNGPNGTWDANTTIWTERRLLFTGYLDPSVSLLQDHTSIGTCSGGGVVNGTVRFLSARLVDSWRNVVTSGSTLSIRHSAAKGTVTVASGTTMLDSYGFGYDRLLVDATTENDCTSSSTRCRWKTLFHGNWDLRFGMQVAGAPITDTDPCADDLVSVGATVQNVLGEVSVGIGIQ